MQLKVKQKIINGKKVMGVIDENLNEVVPFEFKNINEIEFKYYIWSGLNEKHYFICENDDGICSLYDSYGNCRIGSEIGCTKLEILKRSFYYDNSLFVVAKKDDLVGILKASLIIDIDRNHKVTGKTITTEVEYEFGKCDEIIELQDGTVKLIKQVDGKNYIGYWYNKKIGELIEPKFLSYDYSTIKCKSVGLYKLYDNVCRERKNPYYEESDHIEDEKLTFNVETIKYSKLKGKKEVFGLKQKVNDEEASKKSRSSVYKFVDFLPANYSSINYDEEHQVFLLEKMVRNKVKKGLIGVTFDWHIFLHYWTAYGYPNLKVEVDIPCKYDDIQIVGNNYALVKENGKYGIIKFAFGATNGDYSYSNFIKKSNGECHEIVPCIYDTIIPPRSSEPKDIFICDIGNNKKEIIIVNNDSRLFSTHKIGPCDCISSIGSLIKVVNDGKLDLYTEDGEIIEKNIMDVKRSNTHEVGYFIKQNNGHIHVIDNYGNLLFATEKLGITPQDLSVEYSDEIHKFIVTNNGFIKVYSSSNGNYDNAYQDKVFTYFVIFKTSHYVFTYYKEVTDDGLNTKLVQFDKGNKMASLELLSGNINIENILLDKERIIFSEIDSETSQKKYGVIESGKGNICMDCIYDNIQYDKKNNNFICTHDGESLTFDIDGFLIENNKDFGDESQGNGNPVLRLHKIVKIN